MSNTDDPLRGPYPFPHGDGQDAGTANGGSSCDAADFTVKFLRPITAASFRIGQAEGDV